MTAGSLSLQLEGLQNQSAGISWWLWVLIFLVLLILFLWWLNNQMKADAKNEPAPLVKTTAVNKAVSADDLEIIEGIGPKIAGVLKEAGIARFDDLAKAKADTLHEILKAANLRLADPATWQEQARLAAAADWEGLKTLQENLKGGRRV